MKFPYFDMEFCTRFPYSEMEFRVLEMGFPAFEMAFYKKQKSLRIRRRKR